MLGLMRKQQQTNNKPLSKRKEIGLGIDNSWVCGGYVVLSGLVAFGALFFVSIIFSDMET